MKSRNTQKTSYGFVAVPTNLFFLLDANLKSVLSTLIQLSSFYADKDGWFFRSNEDLQMQSRLSKNLVIASLDTLYQKGIIGIRSFKNGKTNFYRVNTEKFQEYENECLDDYKNPMKQIDMLKYKNNYHASYFGNMDNQSCKPLCNLDSNGLGKKVNTNKDNIETKEKEERNINRKKENPFEPIPQSDIDDFFDYIQDENGTMSSDMVLSKVASYNPTMDNLNIVSSNEGSLSNVRRNSPNRALKPTVTHSSIGIEGQTQSNSKGVSETTAAHSHNPIVGDKVRASSSINLQSSVALAPSHPPIAPTPLSPREESVLRYCDKYYNHGYNYNIAELDRVCDLLDTLIEKEGSGYAESTLSKVETTVEYLRQGTKRGFFF